MNKAELIEALEMYTDDIEIRVGFPTTLDIRRSLYKTCMGAAPAYIVLLTDADSTNTSEGKPT
jgi:hypothetical protein